MRTRSKSTGAQGEKTVVKDVGVSKRKMKTSKEAPGIRDSPATKLRQRSRNSKSKKDTDTTPSAPSGDANRPGSLEKNKDTKDKKPLPAKRDSKHPSSNTPVKKTIAKTRTKTAPSTASPKSISRKRNRRRTSGAEKKGSADAAKVSPKPSVAAEAGENPGNATSKTAKKRERSTTRNVAPRVPFAGLQQATVESAVAALMKHFRVAHDYVDDKKGAGAVRLVDDVEKVFLSFQLCAPPMKPSLKVKKV